MEDCQARRHASFAPQNSIYNYEDEEEDNEPEICITINSIENIIRNETLSIKFVVQHGSVSLGESEPMEIDANYGSINRIHPIDFSVGISYAPNDPRSIAPIVSTPVLIRVIELVEHKEPPIPEGKKNKRKKSKVEPIVVAEIEEKVLGLCNVDLLPLFMGEASHEEKLVLETPTYSWDGNSVSWTNLPRICVSLSQDSSRKIQNDQLDFNLLSITVESIYNLPSHFTEDFEYKCATVLSLNYDVEESSVVFDGKWSGHRDVERAKCWKALQDLDSRARFSKYKINCDYDCVKNDFRKELNLKETVRRNEPRIEWNSMHRVLLEAEDVKNMQNQLTKYRHMPFEVLVVPQENLGENDDGLIYQCYVDASQLLFPGRTRARVLAQLHTRSSAAMQQMTGLTTSLFHNDIDQEPSGSNDDRGCWISACGESEAESEGNRPLFTEDGAPVVALIEFELYRPIVRQRHLDDYTEAIEILKSKPRPKSLPYVYTPDLVADQYSDCIKRLTDAIGEAYRDFQENCECPEETKPIALQQAGTRCDKQPINLCKPPSLDSTTNKTNNACPYFYVQDKYSRFLQYLHETGEYVSIRRSLKKRITNLLDQKFALNSPEWASIQNQEFVASAYTYLVENMHVAVNSKLDTRLADSPNESDSLEQLQIRIEEAYESEDYEKADKLLAQTVYDDRYNPDRWTMYAAHFMRMANINEAIECCREAIRLNTRNKVALLYYGLLLAMKEDYTESEIFLRAVTTLYPRYAVGWTVLHLLYIKIQYYPGIDITLQLAEKCSMDRVLDNALPQYLEQQPILWSAVLLQRNRVLLMTVVLMLRLNLYDFAGLALAQELCHGDRDVEFLYFLSVNHYLQRDYNVALKYLEEAELIIGLDFRIAALTGHCHYVNGDMCKAMESYESVDRLYDRPENIYLIQMRLGFYNIENEEYERARNIFLRASKYINACKIWLGVGIASYYLSEFEDCEVALMEANRINCEDPEVWGYLCLFSMTHCRYDEFAQCYRQMVKNKLRSEKLWRLITNLMETLGYSSPIAVLGDSSDRCTC